MRNHRFWKLIAVFLVFGVATFVAGCGGSQSSEIKIGFFAPITGPAAADGESVKRAAELAVKEINDAGGINGKKIQLVAYDDRLDPKEAVNIANKLIGQDKVVAVVSGSYSGTTRAAAPIFQEAKIPMITAYAVHPDITKAGNYMFRQSFLGTVQGRAGAEAAVKLLGAKNISILAVDNDFGKTLSAGFKERAEKLGAKIVSADIFPSGEKEFNPLLTKIKG
ncbi:MAG: ABC transporter substrate-binding protein, partial [Firmicutes bacterium]|nr:ABC transporter substrate-binding protein [Bacillota bacterium]